MIIDSIVNIIVSFLSWIIDGLPSTDQPSWFTDALGVAESVFGFANSMSVWFPVNLVLLVVSSLIAVNLVSFGIKIVRIIASYLTLGGGSAA
jgi:hypothetical protein